MTLLDVRIIAPPHLQERARSVLLHIPGVNGRTENEFAGTN